METMGLLCILLLLLLLRLLLLLGLSEPML